MKKFISHLWHSGGVFEFNSNTGTIVPTKEVEWNNTEFGSVWKQNGKYYVFHLDDGSLLLQHKSVKWRVTPEYKATLRAYFIVRNL